MTFGALDPSISSAEAARHAWDAVVVGAGPAGALAARELARQGAEVLLLDRRHFPRDKICGACLNARSLRLLDAAGLGALIEEEEAEPLARFDLRTPGGRAEIDLPRGAALSRRRLDAALVRAAIAAGAAFLSGQRAILGSVRAGRRTIRLPDAGIEVAACVAIAADGLGGGFVPASRVAQRVREDSRIGAGATLTGWRGAPEAGTIRMAVGRRGYVGLVRVEGGVVNAAAALDPERVRERGLGGAVAEILESTNVEFDEGGLRSAGWHGTGPLTRRPADVAIERLFGIGDSAGYVEPFTGEGMSWAFESALAVTPVALEAIEEWHPMLAERWRRSHRQRIARRQRLCRALAVGLRHPLLLRSAARLFAARPGWAAPLVDRVSGGGAERYVERPLEEGS